MRVGGIHPAYVERSTDRADWVDVSDNGMDATAGHGTCHPVPDAKPGVAKVRVADSNPVVRSKCLVVALHAALGRSSGALLS